jgi:hypothetical protein
MDTKGLSGVCGYSGPDHYLEYAIFEVGNDALADRFEDWVKAHGFGYKRLVGSYKGQTNPAFLMPRRRLVWVEAAGWLSRQESILILGSHKDPASGRVLGSRSAKLVWLDGRPETPLGRFRQVSGSYAKSQPGWTWDPTTGFYWVAEERQPAAA